MNYRQELMQAARQLENAGIAEAANDAWLLLSYVTGISRTRYYMHMTDPMPKEQQEKFAELVAKRADRVPLQHLTGEQEFMGLSFLVNEHVLVPRQDTESLVEKALSMAEPGMKVLDMCTGSGCIIISLAKLCPGITATAVDVSPEALAVARENSMRNHAEVAFIESDLFSGIEGTFDMIVSNPPYIRTAEIAGLMPEVAVHEPILALDGKEDGLYFYRIITEEAVKHLSPDGKLLFEIGNDQGKDVSEMLTNAGFSNVTIRKDLAGNDRVVSGEL